MSKRLKENKELNNDDNDDDDDDDDDDKKPSCFEYVQTEVSASQPGLHWFCGQSIGDIENQRNEGLEDLFVTSTCGGANGVQTWFNTYVCGSGGERRGEFDSH